YSPLLHWMRIWGWKLTLVPPLTSWFMWSPYFFGAKRAAAHLRVSTRNRATLQFSCVAASAISMHSLKNLSACASRARAYWSRKSPLQGTVCKILDQEEVKPHKVRYYSEQRDPEFAEK